MMEHSSKATNSNKFTLGETRVIHDGRFISFCETDITNSEGIKSTWEHISRKSNRVEDPLNIQKNYGGADVIAIATQTEDGDQNIVKTGEKMVLAIIIYRVPIMNSVISLPAGVKDPEDDNPLDTAVRELKEETGFTGENGRSTYTCRCDPWKSDDRGTLVFFDVDLTKEENKNPKQELEMAEDIRPIWIKLDGLKQNLEDLAHKNDYEIDQRLYSFAMGLDYAQHSQI
ncbi:unnamed protein product [Moneuplotes crassus]|uniref:Nudix hydrolase domain-containing protein n=1 Tax=Euplotes crassus TaxID=5936 RepID=A0AAD2D2G9_EUPCR|nr:unnamed protein product [Moneuplotes crassus]